MASNGRRELGLVGAVAIVAGSFLPWFTVTTVFGAVSRTGLDTVDGKATALLGLVAVATVYSGQTIASRVIGVVVAAVGIFNMVDVERLADEPAATVGSGFGLWIVIAGAVVVVAQPELRRTPDKPVLPPPSGPVSS